MKEIKIYSDKTGNLFIPLNQLTEYLGLDHKCQKTKIKEKALPGFSNQFLPITCTHNYMRQKEFIVHRTQKTKCLHLTYLNNYLQTIRLLPEDKKKELLETISSQQPILL